MELIGATKSVIEKAENRELFKKSMTKIGLDSPKGFVVNSVENALEISKNPYLFQ